MESPSMNKRTPSASERRAAMIFVVVVVLGLAGGISWWMRLGPYLAHQWAYTSKSQTFSGNSASLQWTVVVPTLDTPCPPGKNVIWCSSFQLAWNEVRDKVIRAPLKVVGAEEVATRLNAAQESGADLEPKSYYAAGGWIKDGIRDRIKREMAARFSAHAVPDFNDYKEGILAYSYLTAGVPFQHPFEQTKLTFEGSRGMATEVDAFGVWNLLRQYDKIRKQVKVLYCRPEKSGPRIAECALDLCQDSEPYGVIVAMLEPKASLADTLAYLRKCMDEFKTNAGYAHESQLDSVDHLKVPEMFWRIDHRFQELIDKTVANVGEPIVEAMQTIEFRLDRNGAVLESEARFGVTALPREFIFDRPFLVYMQKRGAEQPFFVMWLDNAELLTRR